MEIKTIKQALNECGFVVQNIVGTSMLPLLKEGVNKVKLVPPCELNLFAVVLYKGKDNKYVLHRIIDIQNSELTIIGDNTKVLERKNKNEIVARMTGYYEGSRYIDVLSKEYLNYLENIYQYSNNEKRVKLLSNPSQYFLDRQIDAYFELIKLEITGFLDKDIINQLNPTEKADFFEHMVEKKAMPYLAYAVQSFGVDLGEALNKETIKKSNELLNITVREDVAIDQISKVFNSNNIPHIFLKGSETKKLYRFPNFRVRNDIDLLVKKEDFERACQVIKKEFDSESFYQTEHDISFMVLPINAHLELHHAINHDLPKNIKHVLGDPFEDAIQVDGTSRYVLSDTKMMLHVLSHSASHFKLCWNWIGMILDIYHLSKLKVDFQKIKEARLEKYYQTIINIIEHAVNKKEIGESESFLINVWFSGRLGTESAISKTVYKSKFQYYFYRVFMPYKELASYYPSLKKIPFMYPFYLIVRLLRIVTNNKNRKVAKDEIDRFNNIKKEQANFLYNVGLSEYSKSNIE